MLSHIVSLVSTYEASHGVRPNLVFMNEGHYAALREEMPGVRDHNDVTSILGVDIATVNRPDIKIKYLNI